MATTKATTKAAAYLRVSGLGQVEGDGLRRQRDAIARWAKAHRHEVVAEFSDEGVSGTTELDGRKGLSDLLYRIDTNGVRVVIVENATRLARDVFVQEAILRDFRKRGVRVVSADGDIDLTNNEDSTAILVRELLGSISGHERRTIVNKLRAARDVRSREQGRRIEGAKPFGTLPGEAHTLALMRTLRIKARGQQRLSFAAIASILNDKGHETRHGRPWKPESIRKILGRVTLQTVHVQRQEDGSNTVAKVTERMVRPERLPRD